MELSVIVHTYNSEQTLEHLLSSVDWADEIIVVDMNSEDCSRSIAEKHNARVITTERTGSVDSVRNRFLEYAAHTWILVMDSDEYLPGDAEWRISELLQKHGDSYDAFAFPRYNKIGRTIVRSSGWYPDYQTRLFRKGTVRWSGGFHKPPEVTTGTDRLCTLQPPGCIHIHHHNYRDLAHLVSKQLDYCLKDDYPDDPKQFEYSEYVGSAYMEFAKRHDTNNDGDLSTALATVMAWDRIIRGLVHWDRLTRKPSLKETFSLPLVTTSSENTIAENASLKDELQSRDRQIAEMRAEMNALQADCETMRNSMAMRLCRKLDRAVSVFRRLFR
jgi:glycosyltransferase involved in cell wall biosynthesis